MVRLRMPIVMLMGLVAVACVAAGLAARPFHDVGGGLVTLGVLVIPAVAVLLVYGGDHWRRVFRAVLRAGLTLSFIVAVALGLTAVVVILGFGSLVPVDPVVAAAIATTVWVLLGATAGALFGAPSRRPWCGGAALFGWPFLVVGLAPAFSGEVPVLLTTHALHAGYPSLYLRTYPEPTPDDPTMRQLPLGPRARAMGRIPAGAGYLRFLRIGHCAATLLVAAFGGLLARALAPVPRPVAAADEPRGRPRLFRFGFPSHAQA